MNSNTQTTFASKVSKSGKRFFASITVGTGKACFVWPEILRAILDDPAAARTLLAEIDNLNGVAATAAVIETLATPIPAATVAAPAPVVAVSEPVVQKDPRPAKTPSVHTGTGADIITKSKIDRDDSNARIKASLVAEYKELGIKGYKGNPTFCKVETLRSRIAAHKATESHVVNQPTIVKAATPEVVTVKVSPAATSVTTKSTRTVLGDNLFMLPDGREVYTCVYEDGSIVNEIFAAKAKVA